MEQHDFELRLEKTGEESGTLRLAALSEICSRLPELSTRVGRQVAGAAAVGRLPDHPANVSRLVLRGIHPGSTVLVIGYGEPEVLPFDAGQEIDTAEHFWEVLVGIQSGSRPDWVSPMVAVSAGRLVEATVRAAERVTFRRAD